jgi:hypothetical protein
MWEKSAIVTAVELIAQIAQNRHKNSCSEQKGDKQLIHSFYEILLEITLLQSIFRAYSRQEKK